MATPHSGTRKRNGSTKRSPATRHVAARRTTRRIGDLLPRLFFCMFFWTLERVIKWSSRALKKAIRAPQGPRPCLECTWYSSNFGALGPTLTKLEQSVAEFGQVSREFDQCLPIWANGAQHGRFLPDDGQLLVGVGQTWAEIRPIWVGPIGAGFGRVWRCAPAGVLFRASVFVPRNLLAYVLLLQASRTPAQRRCTLHCAAVGGGAQTPFSATRLLGGRSLHRANEKAYLSFHGQHMTTTPNMICDSVRQSGSWGGGEHCWSCS